MICILRNVFKVAAAWLLGGFLGANGVWASVIMGELLLAPVLLVALRRYRGNGFLSTCMALEAELEHDGRSVFECSMPGTKEALVSTVAEIKAFCTELGVAPGKTMRICLGVEELAGNAVEHAYDNDASCTIDIRLVITDGKVSLSLRDNGKKFNPLAYRLGEEQYGIKLIRGLCKNINYHYIAGVNHLTVVE